MVKKEIDVSIRFYIKIIIKYNNKNDFPLAFWVVFSCETSHKKNSAFSLTANSQVMQQDGVRQWPHS